MTHQKSTVDYEINCKYNRKNQKDKPVYIFSKQPAAWRGSIFL